MRTLELVIGFFIVGTTGILGEKMFVVGAVLSIVAWRAPSLASTHWILSHPVSQLKVFLGIAKCNPGMGQWDENQ